MGNKTASKSKTKPLYASALTKKLGIGKAFHFKGGKPMGGKVKMPYGIHKPTGLTIHDAGHGVKYAEVAHIGEEHAPVENEADMADGLVAEVAETSADVNVLCETYQLRREELGRLTGFSLRALAEWASGKLPSQPAKRRLHEVRRLLDALAEIVKREHIPKWLRQRNAAFDDLTPLQVIEFGEIDRLWRMVYDVGSGQPG